MMDDFKKTLLLDLLQSEIKNVESGSTNYGDAADQYDTLTALIEMRDELSNTSKIGGADVEDRRPRRGVAVKNTGSVTVSGGGVANTGVMIQN